MKKIRQHLDHLFKDVPVSDKKDTIKQEIIDNLEEKVHDLMEQGKEEEDAINKALIEFGDVGDIEDIKKEMGIKKPHKKNMAPINLSFAIWSSALIIAMLLFINFYYTPDVIWFVYPTFAVLWWPLSLLYYWLRTR